MIVFLGPKGISTATNSYDSEFRQLEGVEDVSKSDQIELLRVEILIA